MEVSDLLLFLRKCVFMYKAENCKLQMALPVLLLDEIHGPRNDRIGACVFCIEVCIGVSKIDIT